jgi:hypothetical protein
MEPQTIELERKTRCAFTCTSRTERIGQGWDEEHKTPVSNMRLFDYKFVPVTPRDGDGWKAFWASTPSGQIEVSTVRDSSFEVGKTYFVDFSMIVAKD